MFLKHSYLSLYDFYLIFGYYRQFSIFHLWVSPLWFSTLQLCCNANVGSSNAELTAMKIYGIRPSIYQSCVCQM